MKSKVVVALGLLLLTVAIVYSSGQIESADLGRTVGEEVVYNPVSLPEGNLENLVVEGTGLLLPDSAVTGRYLSPIIDSPINFSAVVPMWTADVPESTSFSLQLRTATAENTWGDWVIIEKNDDWTLPDEDKVVGQMILVPAADETHQKFQFALAFGRYGNTPSPIFRELRFNFIDASQGPTSAELKAMQAATDQEKPSMATDDYPKPPVISRDIWCTDPACDYTEGLSYYPVSHLIVHHTVSSNTSADWAAVVRAIWYFHTFTRGWGDIGYNYLVDMDGVLYEGHLGGDDVVGTHSAAANTGSMALALIGTFTDPDGNPPGISPPPPMMESAAQLFTWKADQKNIDVYDASTLPYMSWGLPHLSGHRDVYGTTQCPGNQAHLLLPWLRAEVKERIGYLQTDYYFDELSSAFTKSNSSWNVPPGGCGFNGHAYYAWSTTDPGDPILWGEWRPPVHFPGVYEIEVYAPYCITGAPETDGAKYVITDQTGTTNMTVSHDDNVGNWMSLGNYDLALGTSSLIRLTNLTTTDNDLGVWFDAIRLRPVQVESATNLSPPPDSGQPRDVTFTWDLTDQVPINSTRLQVATDSGFFDLVLDVPLPPTTTTYDQTFDQDYNDLYWRVVVYTAQNDYATSVPTHFGIDATTPTSLVTNIYGLTDGQYRLFWSGSDAYTGTLTYTIQVRAEGTITWTDWLTDTTLTSALFSPPDSQVYWFRSQAVDFAGNMEPPHPNPGDISTDQAILFTHDIMLPLLEKS